MALDAVSLSAVPGCVLGLLGPNGAGKTTVVNIAAGLARPSGGSVAWRGQPLGFPFPPEVRARVGLLPQDTALYDELSAVENLRFAAELFGVADRKRRVAEVLELVHLEDRGGDRVGTFSGGMRRRLAFGRALVHDPDLLVLDEPTLGVDVDNRHAIWGHVRSLRREGKAVLLCTNYLDEAEALCDTIVALRDGHQVAAGATSELLRSTGRCVEIDCGDDAVAAVRRRIQEIAPGARLEVHDAGLTVHLHADVAAEPVAAAALGTRAVQGVRVRAADMVEVLEALAAPRRG
ncbi:MAG TPA: ABC transporter ATP-binding protein [Acidimicrobiales bacterium]|nr:ABC transporter ATP-binding protein [Acidimicrobiales bacterium]